ncbi:MAG TPA: amino acid adenylation domain-containing protein [Gemmatimonadaceae bacterium]
MSTRSDAVAARRAELERKLAALSPEKRAMLERARATAAEAPRRSAIPARAAGAPVPMSFAQELLWLLDRATPGMHGYNVPRVGRLRGSLDLAALQYALDAIVARHEVLRSTFDLVDGEPRQIVHDPGPIAIELTDLRDRPSDRRVPDAVQIVRELSRRPFDLANDPQLRVSLLRLDDDDHVLLMESHHVASDAWSRNILLSELSTFYEAHRKGTDPGLPPLPVQYGDFARWQREMLAGDALEEHLAYWREQLRDAPALLELPTDRPRPTMPSFEGGSRSRLLPAGLLAKLRALSTAQGHTLFVTLLAAFDVLLARLSGQTDVVVGSPIASRPHEETEGLIGYFANTLVLRTRLDGDPTFLELLARVRETTLGAFEHQDVPFEKLALDLQRGRALGRNGLFQVMMTLQDAQLRTVQLPGLAFEPFGQSRGATKFDLSLFLHERADGLSAGFEYRTDLFDAETIDRMLRRFETLLESIVENPGTRISSLSILPERERRELVHEWSRGEPQSLPADTLHALIAQQVERTPDAIALEMESDSGAMVRMSFRELDERASLLARHLATLGVGPNSAAAICVDRSPELVVAMLAVLKAGGFYLPLDPSYPPERLAFMLDDTRAPVLLTVAGHVATLLAGAAHSTVVLLDTGWSDIAAAAAHAAPISRAASGDDIAYTIYTSGSTGRPKGVMIPHRAVVNYLVWMRSAYPLGTEDAVLQKAPASFDACIWEFFLPLVSGARLVLARPGAHQDPSYLLSAIAKHELTLLQLVPSQLQMLLEYESVAAPAQLARLRRLFLGGEALPSELLARLGAACPSLPVTNLYGPTEATVYATHWSVTAGEWLGGAVPIGRPIANASVHVLRWPNGDGSRAELVPVGVPGELCIGGTGLAHGYLNRPELTAEKFVADLLAIGLTSSDASLTSSDASLTSSDPTLTSDASARLYRTGDRARYRADGTLEYLGRIDNQVKLRGFRVELGEIEAALRALPEVDSAAVLMREDTPGDQRLVAYCITAPGASASDETRAELRAALKRSLPEFMVPTAFVWMDAWPLNANGKLDRKQLPAPTGNVQAAAYVPPKTTIEHELVQIWEDLLERRPIGKHDDFFELGGHSLLAVRMLVEVSRLRGRQIPLAWLFESSTIEGLAARIEGEVQATREPPSVVLQPERTGTPLAFVHGDVRGGGWYCRRLAPLVVPDAPLIVLPTLGSDRDERVWRIPSMAAQHVAELRKVQPTGPYRLAGFCVGGKIALEMARQLREAGETVERLIIIDSGAANARIRYMRRILPFVPGATEQSRLARQADLMVAVRYYDGRVRWVANVPVRQQADWARRLLKRWTQRFRSPASQSSAPKDAARPAMPTREQVDEDLTVSGEQVLLKQLHAVHTYIPQRYDGSIDLIWAEEHANVVLKDPTRGWWRVASDVRVHAIVAHHLGLITNELPSLAAALRTILERKEP